MTHGLTPTGFVAKTYEEIIAELQVHQRSSIDSSLNTSATGVLANINASHALQLAQLWELAQEIYDAHDPNSAQGIAADHNGALSGATRLGQTKSTVTLSVHLQPHTTVVAGSVVSVLGNPRARFVTLADVMSFDAEVDLDVAAEAEAFGALQAAPDTITQIDSPASGWDSVTNPAAAVAGREIETDERYRIRRVDEIASQGGSTAAGVLADVRKLGVSAGAIENDSDATVDGLPPHSFEIIVNGAGPTDGEIAESIWKNKPAGIQTVGSVPVVITDSEGIEHTVRFTRATVVVINVNYHATVDATYALNGVRAAVAAATGEPGNPAYFDIGKTVYLGRLMNAGWSAQGVVNLTMDIARDPAVPADAIPSAVDASIAIGPREVASFGLTSWVAS